MFVKFLIVMGAILVGGAHNEGVIETAEQEGYKAAYEEVVESKQPLDYSKLND